MRARRRVPTLWALGALSGLLVACGGEGGEGSAAPEPMFTEAVEADDCAVLTLADVSQATGVAESELEQLTISGCLYEWDRGNINLLSVRAHETIEEARSYHARFTEDASASDADAAQERVRDDLAEQREEGEITESEEDVAGALVDAMPEEDFRHASLEGVGSEATLDGRGSMRLRYGNVTIWLTAKADGEDVLDPTLARDLATRMVANLDGMG